MRAINSTVVEIIFIRFFRLYQELEFATLEYRQTLEQKLQVQGR